MGQKATSAPQKVMSALPPKADMCGAATDVRFGPKADISAQLILRNLLNSYPDFPGLFLDLADSRVDLVLSDLLGRAASRMPNASLA
jgi:hypothetical protein